MLLFQSTLPAGGSDLDGAGAFRCSLRISIHASSGGSDNDFATFCGYRLGFQSTLPAGEATLRRRKEAGALAISIHASRGGSDSNLGFGDFCVAISIHASRGGSD